MSRAPFFSVVLATYNRGEHIRPTVESVLEQRFSDFELLVVGDGCTDGTEQAVAEIRSPKISWHNLPENSGSQSAPNNAGVHRADGRWVAYIGHDDIWSPDHLQRLREAIETDAGAHFAVSGCIYYGPEGSDVHFVTGLFESDAAPFQNFFPPSSIAHRREIVEQIGDWRPPRELRAPVDCDFLLRAAHAGLRFVSTGRVTVHKFAAGHRYLSYLDPSSTEQAARLRLLRSGATDWVDVIVEGAREAGTFMSMKYPDFSQLPVGSLFERNRRNKGISRPTVHALTERTVIEQSDEPRALDWHRLEGRFRWSGPNPRPSLLLPLTGDEAWIAIEVLRKAPGCALEEVSVSVGARELDGFVLRESEGTAWIVRRGRLDRSEPSVLRLHTPTMFRPSDTGGGDKRRLGIAVGDVVVEPIETPAHSSGRRAPGPFGTQ